MCAVEVELRLAVGAYLSVVTDCRALLGYATTGGAGFNEDISRWDVSRIKSFGCGDKSKGDCGGWFKSFGAAFNQDLSRWDTSSLLVMRVRRVPAAAGRHQCNCYGWGLRVLKRFNSS